MKFRLLLVGGWLMLMSFQLGAQGAEYAREEVLTVLRMFFEALQEGDGQRARALFHPQAVLFTAPAGELAATRQIALDDFLTALAAPRKARWEEKLWSRQVRQDGNLATAWTDYSFFTDGQLSHCGVNAFQLVREKGEWQILSVTDTRRKTGCPEAQPERQVKLDRLMDEWHRAAARADEEVFFGTMLSEGVYLGTDASEYWLRDELRAWSATYFDRDTAWDFTPHHRHWYFAAGGEIAWFDELLDTWMGTCRGSGVLAKQADGQWKLAHYNLAVLVPNEKIEGYKELIGKD